MTKDLSLIEKICKKHGLKLKYHSAICYVYEAADEDIDSDVRRVVNGNLEVTIYAPLQGLTEQATLELEDELDLLREKRKCPKK